MFEMADFHFCFDLGPFALFILNNILLGDQCIFSDSIVVSELLESQILQYVTPTYPFLSFSPQGRTVKATSAWPVYNITVDCSSQSKLLKTTASQLVLDFATLFFSMKMCGFVGFLILQRGTKAKLVEKGCKVYILL